MNPFEYVDVQRKKSNIPGTGIQYLPGHKDDFVDHCTLMIRSERKAALMILEIGGGGLRFASSILTSTNVSRIHVVDPDGYALDHHAIFRRCQMDQLHFQLFKKKCILIPETISEYLASLAREVAFDYVCAFRVFHFFSPKQFADIVRSISHHLRPNGIFCLSGISFYDNQASNTPNDLFRFSSPINDCNNYRRLDLANPQVAEEVKKQNLGERMLFFDRQFLDNLLVPCQMRPLSPEIISTRVVRGYIYKHVDGSIQASPI